MEKTRVFVADVKEKLLLLLPRFRQPPTVNVARLRERAAQWQAHATDEEEPTT